MSDSATPSPSLIAYHVSADLFTSFSTKQDFFTFAAACELGKRYYDLVTCMTAYVSSPIMTNVAWANEERTLLAVGYKGVVRPLRHAILSLSQHLDSLPQGSSSSSSALRHSLLLQRDGLVREMDLHCTRFIAIIEKRLLGESGFQDDEALIWAYKTVGDHRRYQAELAQCGAGALADEDASSSSSSSSVLSMAKEQAQEAFSRGMLEAQIKLNPTAILRLSLALNFASFRYEIIKDYAGAQHIAQEAMDLAETELLGLPHTPLPDTEHLIRMLHQQLDLWKKQPSPQ